MSLVAQTEFGEAELCYAEGEEEGQVREQEGAAQEAEYQAQEALGKFQLQLELQLQLRGPSQQLQAATKPPTANPAGKGAAG
jgi:hypothetical protein